jgi:hypothetical protein
MITIVSILYSFYNLFLIEAIIALLKYGIVGVQMKDSTQNSSLQFFSTRELYISSAIKMGMNHISFIYLQTQYSFSNRFFIYICLDVIFSKTTLK